MGIHKITTLSAIIAMAFLPVVTSAATGTVASGSTATATTSVLHEELNVPGAPVLVSSTATSATLSWAKVPAATSYVVKYSKNSVAEAFKAGKTAVYEIETDPVTATGTTIKDLATGSTYYFAVVALDKDNNESATNSPELSVKVSAETAVTAPVATSVATTGATASSFKLASVVASSTKSLTLEFSAPLSTTTPVTLKISKTLDNSAVAVASVVVDTKDAKKATVSLAGALDPSSSYSVTIISAKDSTGLTIAEGVNAIKEFATSANLSVASGTTPVALNAAPTASGATGSTLSGATVPATATTTATGAQQNLLLVLAAVLSLGIIYVARRKRA
ncbi:MAG: fibronectin type III domain-containing protein [Patescibacteria group bacterium]